jgi:carbohydrate kinase (thermoresistant glucokinase family)
MLEGDDLHPPANIAKMKRHEPLNDADRQPWLAAIGEHIDGWRAQHSAGIITCSALKRSYRDQLIAGRDNLWFVYLKGSKQLISARLAQRKGHFMPPDLLDSQLADLEEPTAEERAIIADIAPPPGEIAAGIIAALQEKVSQP